MDREIWQEVLIPPSLDLISAMTLLNKVALQILLVVDQSERLVGVITDGDLRRYLLKHGNHDATVDKAMNTTPRVALLGEHHEQMFIKMQTLKILQLPIVDENNRVVGLETLQALSVQKEHDNFILFMAGGTGERLRPLTQDCPKPLLKIGNKPILEILLENCVRNGFRHFYFSVNYKSTMIRDYFGDGRKWGTHIQYIEETEKLGTAGSLSLLPELPKKTFFLVNAYIVTNMNFETILNFHQENSPFAAATVCVRQQKTVIPYGVVNIHEQHCGLINIQEKPTREFFINAGIYVLNPDTLSYLHYNQYCDMPGFLLRLIKENKHVATFPICEYWLDVGHHDTLKRAEAEYMEVFS